MLVNSYLFQSPYSQPVQVGRPDPVGIQKNSEELQKEEKQIQAETQNFSVQKSSLEETQAQIKSSALYAVSEAFGMSADQVKELSNASKNSKRSELARVYSNSGA